MEDLGASHTGCCPGSTDMGVGAESADLRFPQRRQSMIRYWCRLELPDTTGC